MKWIRWIGAFALGGALGLGGGYVVADWTLDNLDTFHGNQVESRGQWGYFPDLGSAEASPVVRAHVARYGILGLPRSEVLYFQAGAEGSDIRIKGNCTYTITLGDLPARWWSITAYDGNGAYLQDVSHASVNHHLARRDGDMHRITMGPGTTDRADLPLSGEGDIILLLRLYVPDQDAIDNPDQVPLPVIEEVGSCA